MKFAGNGSISVRWRDRRLNVLKPLYVRIFVMACLNLWRSMPTLSLDGAMQYLVKHQQGRRISAALVWE